MKKNTYSAPCVTVVELNARGVFMNLSAGDTLGVGFMGDTASSEIEIADVKGTSRHNIWDQEW